MRLQYSYPQILVIEGKKTNKFIQEFAYTHTRKKIILSPTKLGLISILSCRLTKSAFLSFVLMDFFVYKVELLLSELFQLHNIQLHYP